MLAVWGAAFYLAGAVLANAVVVITDVGGAAPGSFAIGATTEDGTTTVRWRNSGTDRDLGQRFRVDSTFVLDSIILKVNTHGADAPGQSFVVQFYSTDATGSTFTSLWEDSGTLPATLTNGNFLRLNVSSQAQTLNAGSYYAFVVGFGAEGSSTREIGFATHSAGTFQADEGREVRREWGSGVDPTRTGAVVNSGVGRDMRFYLTAVPEPSTYAMLALGLASLLGLRRLAGRGNK